jgi:hypothetical protein
MATLWLASPAANQIPPLLFALQAAAPHTQSHLPCRGDSNKQMVAGVRADGR